jgi:hypothetical protein
MAKTAMGMSKETLGQALNGSAAVFGVTGLFAPRMLGAAYGVPPSPHTAQLLRLFGSRMLALAAVGFTARTPEEKDRLLAVAVALNVVDAVTALAAGSGTGRSTAVRAAVTSGGFAVLGAVVRSLED